MNVLIRKGTLSTSGAAPALLAMPPVRLELTTFALKARCSDQLSYGGESSLDRRTCEQKLCQFGRPAPYRCVAPG